MKLSDELKEQVVEVRNSKKFKWGWNTVVEILHYFIPKVEQQEKLIKEMIDALLILNTECDFCRQEIKNNDCFFSKDRVCSNRKFRIIIQQAKEFLKDNLDELY